MGQKHTHCEQRGSWHRHKAAVLKHTVTAPTHLLLRVPLPELFGAVKPSLHNVPCRGRDARLAHLPKLPVQYLDGVKVWGGGSERWSPRGRLLRARSARCTPHTHAHMHTHLAHMFLQHALLVFFRNELPVEHEHQLTKTKAAQHTRPSPWAADPTTSNTRS
jgi:hypothetical protein